MSFFFFLKTSFRKLKNLSICLFTIWYVPIWEKLLLPWPCSLIIHFEVKFISIPLNMQSASCLQQLCHESHCGSVVCLTESFIKVCLFINELNENKFYKLFKIWCHTYSGILIYHWLKSTFRSTKRFKTRSCGIYDWIGQTRHIAVKS